MGKYTEKDARRDTGVGRKEVSHAWHQARQDARKSGEIPSGSGCFIATAAYGSYLEPQVETLRSFRDNCLLTSSIGILAVRAYYRLSPSIANAVRKNKFLKVLARMILTPIVHLLK